MAGPHWFFPSLGFLICENGLLLPAQGSEEEQ